MNTIIRNIVQQMWGLMMKTSDTWEKINILENKKYASLKYFFIPSILFCGIIVFFFESFYAKERVIETGFIHFIGFLLSYIGTFFVTLKICYFYFSNKSDKQIITNENIAKFLSRSFTVIIITKIVVTIFPSVFFIQILNIYTAYITWEGSKIIFKANEEEQTKIMIITCLALFLLPLLFNRIISFMLPAF